MNSEQFLEQYNNRLKANKFAKKLLDQAADVPIGSPNQIRAILHGLQKQIERMWETDFTVDKKSLGIVRVGDQNVVKATKAFEQKSRILAAMSSMRESQKALERFFAPLKKDIKPSFQIEIEPYLDKLPEGLENPLLVIDRHFGRAGTLRQLFTDPELSGKSLDRRFLLPLLRLTRRLYAACLSLPKDATMSEEANLARCMHMWCLAKYASFGHLDAYLKDFSFKERLGGIDPSDVLDWEESIVIWKRLLEATCRSSHAEPWHRYARTPFLTAAALYRCKSLADHFDVEFVIYTALDGIDALLEKDIMAALFFMKFLTIFDPHNTLQMPGLVPRLCSALNKVERAASHYGAPPHLVPFLGSFEFWLYWNRPRSADITNIGIGFDSLFSDLVFSDLVGDFRKYTAYDWNEMAAKVASMALDEGSVDLAESMLLLILLRNLRRRWAVEPWMDIWQLSRRLAQMCRPAYAKGMVSLCDILAGYYARRGKPWAEERFINLGGLFARVAHPIPRPPAGVRGIEKIWEQSEEVRERALVKRLIREHESKAVEFKATARWDIRQQRINKNLSLECIQAIAAFMNTEGGDLLIGVQDDGGIFGIEKDLENGKWNRDKFERHVRDLIEKHLGPLAGGGVEFFFSTIDGKTVCRIHCNKANDPVFFGHEEFFVREGNRSKKLNPEAMVKYIEGYFSSGSQPA